MPMGRIPWSLGTVIANVRGIDMDVKTQAFNPVRGQWLDSFQIDAMSWDPAKGVIVTIRRTIRPTHRTPTSTT